jgi:hypothetical protein
MSASHPQRAVSNRPIADIPIKATGGIMLISALLLASASFSVPNVSDAAGFFAVKMNLERIWHNGRQIAATVNLWVEPSSKVTKCSVGRFLGDELTAKSFCPLLLGRLLSYPRDSQGQRTYAFLSVPIFANVRGKEKDFKKLIQEFDDLPISGDADAEIAVPGVSIPPDKVHGVNFDYGIDVEIAANGAIAHCEKEGKTPEEVAERACMIAKAKNFTVRYSAVQQPVSYVRNVRIVMQSPV